MMLLKAERTALLLMVAVAAILGAGYFVLEGMGRLPFAAPYGPEAHEGDLVVLGGPVESVTWTRTGGHCLLAINGTRVFVPSSVASRVRVRQGDQVTLLGTVQAYQGRQEIVVKDPADIRIVP